jgi:hypothetical protein
MSIHPARDAEADRALLRRFEPILSFNRGESFFPMDVEPYIRQCSLWVQFPGVAPRCLLPEGQLTLDTLVDNRAHGFDAVHYLQFIEPLNLAELARYRLEQARQKRKRDPRDVFQAGQGRLARVGYGSRFVDALFQLTLLARGRVPGDTSAAAAMTYHRLMGDTPRYHYYGRVVRENDWIVLQYWFFYAYNNWRSAFFGVNDHEADWEQVCVYVYQDDEERIHPAWVAYASHDFSGDDLRRRWDDPALDREGDHPIVYVGAGSHASYFQPGEYLAEIEIPFLAPLARLAERIQKARQSALEEYYGEQVRRQVAQSEVNIFRVPFVDYARGDGHCVGPGQERAWSEPGLLAPTPDWALLYRGLWGLYAHDPLSGEDAPAGPVYNRDGSVRKAWYDPLGWAGLDKVSPPSVALERTYNERAVVLDRLADDRRAVAAISGDLVRLGVEAEAMRGMPHLKTLFSDQQRRIDGLIAERDHIRASLSEGEALLEALDEHIERLQEGDLGPLRAHIRRAHHPIPEEQLRLGKLAEFWAAISIALMVIVLLVLFIFKPGSLWIGLATTGALFLLIEASFRRWLGQLITAFGVILALVCSTILVIDFWRPILIGLVLVVAAYLLVDNLRELWT